MLRPLAAAATAALLLVLPAAAQAAPQRCGSFDKRAGDGETLRLTVFRDKPYVSCKSAKRIARYFWGGRGVKKHGGPTVADTYYTLRRYRSYRCFEGSGGGSCERRKGRRVTVSWQSRYL